MKRLAIFGLVVGSLLLGACGGGEKAASRPRHDMEGTVKVWRLKSERLDDFCFSPTMFSFIDAHTTLNVTDDDGDVVSSTTLGPGRSHRTSDKPVNAGSSLDGYCVYDYVMPAVPELEVYHFGIPGHYGEDDDNDTVYLEDFRHPDGSLDPPDHGPYLTFGLESLASG